MPLPTPGSDQPWPPVTVKDQYKDYERFAALYAGDVKSMMELEKGYGSFWGRQQRLETERRARLHVPLPADLSSTSATLLFSESPAVTVPEAHGDKKKADAEATEEAVQQFIELGDVYSRLIQAGETASAFGGVFLKIDWDVDFAKFPILTVVQPDTAIPEFRYGFLTAVTLWRVVKTDGQRVWRHIERHETGLDGRGIVLHGLYDGTSERLGVARDLDVLDETAGLKPFIRLPITGLAIRYVPNLLPNRKYRGEPIGRSDYAGAEHLFDAMDEAYNDWLREFRLGKARLTVPDVYLKPTKDSTPRFDLDQEVYASLNVPPSAGVGITASQFAIRGEEFVRVLINIEQRVLHHAGLSAKGQGAYTESDTVMTATQVQVQERRSLMMQQLKTRYWEPTLSDLLEIMQEIHNWLIAEGMMRGDTITVYRPEVKLADSLTPSPVELAGTALAFRNAGFSNEFVAKTGMPDASPEEIAEEVKRMSNESGMQVPEPFPAGVA